MFERINTHIIVPSLGADGAISYSKICSDILLFTTLLKSETGILALYPDAVIPSVDRI
jgi:hypothetical protein